MINDAEKLELCANATRKAILGVLAREGTLSSRAVADKVGITQQLAYHHLTMLANAGITAMELAEGGRHKVAYHSLAAKAIVFAVEPIVPGAQRYIVNCARCDEQHKDLLLIPLPRGDGQLYGTCPTTGAPVLCPGPTLPASSSTPAPAQG